jgi:ubiquitin carboxyl-terminal hydrolase 22/27/51
MNAIHTHIGESLIVEQEERLQRKMEASHLDRGESMDVDSTTLGNLPADIVKDEDLYTEDSFSDEKCVCVTHKAFAGFLRSDVHCLTCHNISTVKEAFLDISLDMETLDRSQIVSKGTQEPLTLYDGLERFTQIETLDSFHCDACHTRAACTKQLSIEQLPLTLCFHLKRFKHTFTSTRKIDTYMQFPLNIDMTPYTFMSTSAQGAPLPKAFGEVGGFSDPTWESLEGEIPPPDLLPNGINPVFHSSPSNEPVSPAIGASKKGPVPRADRSIYSLYAVVNHSGNTENGHYTSFVRHGDSWFKCDDHAITKATVKEVLVSRAYLLFYCRSVLEYQE